MINHIFLIDDDELVNFLNKEIILESYPQKRITCFENALTALDAINDKLYQKSNDLPQIIFLDVNMPIMDGWEFLDEFVKMPEHFLNNCKVVMLSSSIDPRDLDRAKSYKMVLDYISKPISNQQLSEIFT